jgi:hypothetical protein
MKSILKATSAVTKEFQKTALGFQNQLWLTFFAENFDRFRKTVDLGTSVFHKLFCDWLHLRLSVKSVEIIKYLTGAVKKIIFEQLGN